MKLFRQAATTAAAVAGSVAGLTASQVYGFKKNLDTLSAANKEERARTAELKARLLRRKSVDKVPRMESKFPAPHK